MLRPVVLLALSLLAAAAEGHGPVGNHGEQAGHDQGAVGAPLAPLPRSVPEAPVPPSLDAELDPADRLDRRLRALLTEREQRIDTLVQAGAVAAKPQPVQDPILDDPRAARARAWEELLVALRGHAERTPSQRRDDLDRPVGEGLAATLAADPIVVRNRLAAVEVLKDLASSPEGTAQDLEDGLATLGRIDTARLSERERALAAYLRLWFVAETLRRLPVAERAAASALQREAVAARTALVGGFPASELAIAADALVAGLDLIP
jgi:hypothetical protein